ncbi:hypothetical protein ACFW9F_23155 [Streptomyces sp. NPDC059506]|uniref:hypothetical protein n=1 Tax=Streptomyces TaxID=1883 RepID=UPI000CBB52B9|nr:MULTISPECIES: hypothetical protein [unclassified Streptomyces]MCZ2528265.1 hypothetical protein [Streptomyces sp. HB2AG]PLW71736.1 hypothetical protein C0036_16270 [Streptomyces sp. DJ]QMV24624.1 hypothetical protein GQS52_25860 [Streptomyces sp. SCUT-3]
MQPLECGRCGGRVQVEKYSWQHTSVQWTAASRAGCAELRGAGGGSAGSCGALRESIRRAALDGLITVPDPDGEGKEEEEGAR